MKTNKMELMNTVYDTLMGNVGMSKHHVKFPIDNVDNATIFSDTIEFDMNDGKSYRLYIEEITNEN